MILAPRKHACTETEFVMSMRCCKPRCGAVAFPEAAKQCRCGLDADATQSIGKQCVAAKLAQHRAGHGMPARSSRSPYSWESPGPRKPDLGAYDPIGQTCGAKQHASRMTMPQAEYKAWQDRLDASRSAQAAQAQRRAVAAAGCHLGPVLRCKHLQSQHECNAPLPPRALPHAIHLDGLAPFAPPRKLAQAAAH
jgi:hypothetical protein